jgi:AcrR family transcriptional regulator
MAPSITTARRAREFAAREELIIREARKFLLERGFQGWNMEDLAQVVEYSKGTLYQHFNSKEDLALAVVTGSLEQRANLFDKAMALQGRSRERIRAICCACCEFATAHPDYFHVDLMLKSVSFWDKASEERREDHRFQAGRCWRTVQQIIIEAQAVGDLPKDQVRPEEATFALISVTVGSHIMSMEADLRVMAGITDMMATVRRNGDLMCDGLGWLPLSRDFDYAATDRRIVKEIFPDAKWLKAS